MSTLASSPAIVEKDTVLRASKPSFFGLVRGELFKISRQWTTWIMLVLFMGVIFLPYLIMFVEKDIKEIITAPGGEYFYSRVAAGLALIRIFGGFFLIILTARTIGQEYQLGTIRILLARGVGRVQLLLAKLTAVVFWTCILLLVGLLLNALLALAQVQFVTGNLDAVTGLNSAVWHDLGVYVLTILVSMASTILMATAITVLVRSLAGGLSASIAWFPADNIVVIILMVAYEITGSTFWKNISAYLLGPNLNIMAGAVANQQRGAWMFGQAPLIPVDGTHTLLVAAVYSLIFAVIAFTLTWKRDVKE
jgi:ABC-2 type transport system permease protein